MRPSRYGEIVLDTDDVVDHLMRGHDIEDLRDITVQGIDIVAVADMLPDLGCVNTWRRPESRDITVQQFDREHQQRWMMPLEYLQLDIAQLVLDRCTTPEELQRAGQELLMFQERGMMDLLRYMKYLVDVMTQNRIIWGVGRGSSVASFVLYLLGVHRINSLYYELDPQEFLR